MSHKNIHRRFLHNAGLIVGGRLTFGLMNLGTNAIILHAFGAADLGMLMLLIAYVRLFAEVVKFESWQAVLRFGVIAEDRGEQNQLRRLIGLALGIDFITMIPAIIISILLIPQAAVWFGWNEEITRIAPWFMILIIFVTNATPNGVLRLFDRLEIIALQHGLNAIIRLLMVLLALRFDGEVQHLAWAWFVALVLSGLLPMVVCAHELYKRNLPPVFSLNWRKASRIFPGIWRFLLMSNLISSGLMVEKHVTTLIVGAQLGTAQVAVLQIARQIATGITTPARLLGPLLLPDYSRLSGRGDWTGLRDLLVKQLKVTAIIVAGSGVVLFAILPLLVETLFGTDMLEYIWLFRLMLLTTLVNTLGFSLQHAMFSANKSGTALLTQFAAMFVYFIVLFSLLWVIGVNAVGYATLSYALTSRGLTIYIGRRLLKKRIKRSKATDATTINPDP